MPNPSFTPSAESRAYRLAELRARLDADLARHLDGAREVALLDFPDHDNVGDSLIWVGTRDALRRIGVRVVYAAPHQYTDVEHVRRLGVPVLFAGGGNFGDLWPETHAARLDAIERLADRRVLVLPQSVHFGAPGADAETVRVLTEHPDATLLVRDEPSLAWAQGHGVRAALVPDAALGADAHRWDRRPAGAEHAWPGPDEPVVALWRTDKEARAQSGRAEGAVAIRTVDWPSPADLGRRVERALLRAQLVLGAPAPLRRLAGAACDAMAVREVERGLRLLGDERVLITDRLHATVLGLGTGRAVCRVDNSYGKLAAVLDLWWPGDARMVVAGSRADAVAWADGLPLP